MSEPTSIEAEELIEFNKLLVSASGEPFAIISPDLLYSAVYRPRHLLHYNGDEDLVRLGCALAASIARNHAFQQGNKRTAQVALFRILWINGFTFADPDHPELAEALIHLIEHAISEDDNFEVIDRHVIDR